MASWSIRGAGTLNLGISHILIIGDDQKLVGTFESPSACSLDLTRNVNAWLNARVRARVGHEAP